MATDAEIDAAVKAMRAVRTVGGKVHDEVLRAYARAALDAAARVQIEAYRKRAELKQHASAADPPADRSNGGSPHGS